MCILGAPISFVLSDQQDVAFVLISFFIVFCSSTTLCLVFVPKLIQLRHNPEGIEPRKMRATLKPPKRNRQPSIDENLQHNLQKAKANNNLLRQHLEHEDALIMVRT
ncbi:unnamed protein product, partial [Cyprideis torosa]